MVKFKKYNIDELKHLQELELKILKEFISLCDSHDLKYYAYAGTGIGAIRHEGFIPWDDDIDIAMFRDDYEKLLKIMDSELSDEYYVLNFYKHDDCYFPITRICLEGTKFKDVFSPPVSFDEGICIDIFPLDNVPESSIKRKIHHYKCSIYYHLILNSQFKFNHPNKILSTIHSLIRHTIKRIPGTKILIKRYMNSLKKYNNKTNYVSEPVSQTDALSLERYVLFEKKDFEPSQKVKFEDIEINMPHNYDKILTTIFGNYMDLPPEEERYNHSGYIIDFGEY